MELEVVLLAGPAKLASLASSPSSSGSGEDGGVTRRLCGCGSGEADDSGKPLGSGSYDIC